MSRQYEWAQKVIQVSQRDADICRYCGVLCDGETGEDTDFTVDHVVPRIRGGTDDLSNLVACCRLCNTYKGSKDVDAFMRRLVKRTLRKH